MKRLIALLLSAFMIMMTTVTVIPAAAAVNDGIYVTKEQVKRGDTFEVNIVVPAIENSADSVSVRVEFDDNAFTVESWSTGIAGATETSVDKCNGFFAASYGSSTPNVDLSKGLTMTAKMKVKDTAIIGGYDFKISRSDISRVGDDDPAPETLWTASKTEQHIEVKESSDDYSRVTQGGGISLGNTTLRTGDEFDVNINIPALPYKADTISLRVTFDSTAFEVVSWTGLPGALSNYDAGFFVTNYSNAVADYDFTKQTTLTARLRVKTGALSKTYTFTLAKYNISALADNGIDNYILWQPDDTARTAEVTADDVDQIPVVGGGISVSDYTLMPGDTFLVYVNVPRIYYYADTIDLRVDYDSSAFELVSWNSGIRGASDTDLNVVRDYYGTSYSSRTPDVDFSGGKLFTAEMKVRNNALKGHYHFELDTASISYFDDLNLRHSIWTPKVIDAEVQIGDDPYPIQSDGISVSNTRPYRNSEFKVYVKIPAIPQNASEANINVVFNENVFQVVKWEPVLPGVTAGIGNGYFDLRTTRSTSIYLAGGLTLEATLRVKSDAPSGTFDIRLASSSLSYDDNGKSHELWIPLTYRASVTIDGTSPSPYIDPYVVYGGGISVNPNQVKAGGRFNVYVTIPAINAYADSVSIRVNYDGSAFDLVSWEPSVYGGYSNTGYGYFGITASNANRSIDLNYGRTYTAVMKAKNNAYVGKYTFELTGNGFSYLMSNGYEWQRVWAPATSYATLYVYSSYSPENPYIYIDPVITRGTDNSPYVTNVPSTRRTTMQTYAPVSQPSDEDTTRQTRYDPDVPDEPDDPYEPYEDITQSSSTRDITISLNAELDGLGGDKVTVSTKKGFFRNDTLITLKRSSASDTSAKNALANLGMSDHRYYAFDISVYDMGFGNYIHSLGDGYIEFDIPVPETMRSELSSIAVYHTESSYPQRLNSNVRIDNGVPKIHFVGTSFSPYMIVGAKIQGGGGSTMIDPAGTATDPGNRNPHTGVAAAVIIPAAVTGCVILSRKQKKRRRRNDR